MNTHRPRKLILIEMNEITWRLVDPLLARGQLPNFAKLAARGVRASPIADEQGADLDPWISWTTVHTGRRAAEHGVKFLEQPPETVTGPRLWDIVADAGRPVGVFGSIMSWPPRKDIAGFWVPGTFSPGYETFPPQLEAIQELNLSYTREHSPVAGNLRRRMSRPELLLRLKALGLRTATVARIAGFYARRVLGLAQPWEKVSMQPLINFDFFEKLWKRHRPAFATFHTNHVAHYQHRYWRAADPGPFLEKPDDAEVRRYGDAIGFGYRVADELLGRVMAMAGDDTIVAVASGLAQQPYVTEEFRGGRSVVRLRDIGRVLELIGMQGQCVPYSVMAPQWNLPFADIATRQAAERALEAAWIGTPEQKLFACTGAGNTLCINVRQKLPRPIDWDAECVFPTTGQRLRMRELCAEKDPTPKQGCHDRRGLLLMAGPGIAAGRDLGECSTLDLAPTFLHALRLPKPDYMPGHVLHAAFTDAPAPQRAPAVAAAPAFDPIGQHEAA
ncbi:MAG: alkaline phosphatase family protein [Pseudoxanthomonas sp.]